MEHSVVIHPTIILSLKTTDKTIIYGSIPVIKNINPPYPNISLSDYNGYSK